MRARSTKSTRIAARRRELVKSMLAEDPRCELGPVIAKFVADHRCFGTATGLHELRKRSAGGSLFNPANLRRACNPCNDWVEDRPSLARRLGLVVRAGDPKWEELDAANDERMTDVG